MSLAIGNLAGANLANLLLLLGIIAAFGSIHIDRRTLRLDLPAVVVATAILWLLLLDGWLRWIDGVVLLTVAVAYLAQLIRPAKHQQTLAGPHRSEGPRRAAIWRVVFHLAVVAAGIVALVFGADWLVDAAVGIAQASGVSNAMIGLTVVALGTTMPELRPRSCRSHAASRASVSAISSDRASSTSRWCSGPPCCSCLARSSPIPTWSVATSP